MRKLRGKKKGYGELSTLIHSFNDMVGKLIEKDKAIENYIEEQKEAVRLSSELVQKARRYSRTLFLPRRFLQIAMSAFLPSTCQLTNVLETGTRITTTRVVGCLGSCCRCCWSRGRFSYVYCDACRWVHKLYFR